jgi:hypothetical protein
MRNLVIAGILMSGMPAGPSVLGENKTDDVEQLKQKVAQLEKQVREIAQLLEPLKTQQAAESRRKALRPKFEKRMAQDREKHTPEQMHEAENLMRMADQQWGSAEANQSCQTLIRKYPGLDRAGCAMLYIAQMSRGDDRAKYLQNCIEKYDDCFYGDGVQVGAYARFLLAADYRSKGEGEKATALYTELKSKYPDAIDHNGRLLAESSDADSK